MNRTLIEWALNPDGSPGYTWNPITGCLNHINGLCKGGGFPCYAYRLANGRLKQRYLANKNIAPRMNVSGKTAENYMEFLKDETALADPFYPRFWEEKLEELAKRNESINYRHGYSIKQRGIFPCDMSDLFGIGVPTKWTQDILDLIRENNYDRFYLLTKQAARLSQFSPFPENCWVGVTATNQESYYEGVSNIARIEAKVKFVSFEPLLEQINGGECAEERRLDSIDEFDWVIIGACTGSLADMQALRARYPALEIRDNKTFTKFVAVPPPAWVREIITPADAANVPVFIKDNILNTAWGDYRLTEGRREFPKG